MLVVSSSCNPNTTIPITCVVAHHTYIVSPKHIHLYLRPSSLALMKTPIRAQHIPLPTTFSILLPLPSLSKTAPRRE